MLKLLIKIVFISVFLFIGKCVFAINPYYYGSDIDILNTNINDAVNSDINPGQEISNPIREGAHKLVNAEDGSPEHILGGIIRNDDEIGNHQTAMDETMTLIKKGVNYALSLLGLIALIYLIYHGFLILTAGGKDDQYKNGMKGLRIAAIAIAGIALSWLFVSLVFYILTIIL